MGGRAHHRRTTTELQIGRKATLFVTAIIVLCALTTLSILGITIARPSQDNTAIIATLVGVTAPIIAALLAATVQQVHLAVNSRLSQLLKSTASASQAKGESIEKEKHAQTRSTPEPP